MEGEATGSEGASPQPLSTVSHIAGARSFAWPPTLPRPTLGPRDMTLSRGAGCVSIALEDEEARRKDPQKRDATHDETRPPNRAGVASLARRLRDSGRERRVTCHGPMGGGQRSAPSRRGDSDTARHSDRDDGGASNRVTGTSGACQTYSCVRYWCPLP
jgi:hypothetical protein